MTVRVAMWSGPRNISTAMMRAWGNRPDTFVCDEPLYAHYLKATGVDHPGAGEVIAHHETDWRKVAAWLTGPVPHGRSIFYQKHMAHHLLADIDRSWLNELTHAFLIRDPKEMILSYARTREGMTLADTGLPQQVEVFEHVRKQLGGTPPVLDARDVRENPRRTLTLLCESLGVPFTDAMLHWPPGRRETDGVWAKHWYHAVEQSTGFEPYQPKENPLPAHLRPLHEQCLPYYEHLFAQRIR